MLDPFALSASLDSLQTCDASESTLMAASQFLENTYGEFSHASRAGSRAATPMIVRYPELDFRHVNSPKAALTRSENPDTMPGTFPESASSSPKSIRLVSEAEETLRLKDR